MKNLFKNLMLVAVAAMGFTACEQVIDDVNATNEKFTVNIVGEFADDTRSGFLEKDKDATAYKSAWDGSETVRFALIPETFTDETTVTVKDEENKIAGNSATFAPTFDSNEGTIHAFSPKGVYDKNDASACKGGFTSNPITPTYKNVYVVVPAEQTTTAISVDPAAHILAGKADFAENVNMTFNHVVAYGKMTIKNFAGDIDKVEITASESLAGISCKYYYADSDENSAGELVGANVNTITINNLDEAKDNKVFWFGCAPADLTGTTLKVKIYSGEDTYTRNVAIIKTLKFQQGRVASFSVSMEGIEADVKEEVVDPTTLTYTLVTNVADLAVGDKVIIVAKETDVAMSTNQKTNNRGQVTVTKNGNTIAYVDDLQILTLEAGKTSGTFAFNTGSGYLYAASSSENYLRTETTLSANSSWSITIADGIATVKAQGTNTHNWMRYNQSSTLFSCYSSGQKDICIYKGVEAGTDGLTAQTLSFPQSVYTITMEDTFDAPTVSGAQTTVTYTSSNTDVATVNANSGAVTVMGTGTTTITASAIEANGYRAAEASYTLTVNPVGGGAKTYTLQFGSNYNSKGQSSYSNSWYVTCNDFIWDIVNANNNNNGWSYIKIGSNKAAYVGKITTRNVMPETIKTVTMSVSAITADYINSIKLYVATDSAFSKDVQTISVTPAKGDLIFNIPTPTANCFYKIEVDCKTAKSNGPITITKVVYTNE